MFYTNVCAGDGLYLGVPPKLHAVIREAFSEVAGSRMCDTNCY